MLRITLSKNGAGAAKYFEEGLQRGDYYATKEQSVGAWGGKAAARLGLSGEVQKEDFVALCHNQQPDGSKLNPRHSDTRRVGNDFTFSVPKSVSVAYAITGDERIRDAFEQSVEQTMNEVERNMRTQIGQGKDKQHAVTGEMVWASFTHLTSRPVDGVPDPHLHRHCFAFNTTWNEARGRFQAGEFGTIRHTAPYYEAAFHARLAMKVKQLGYGVERKVNAKGQQSWEIANIDDAAMLEKFSHRTSLIEKIAAEKAAKEGPLTAKQKAQLGALTREKKAVGQSYDKLREVWQSRLSDEESDTVMAAHRQPFAGEKKNAMTAAKEAVNRAQQHLFERKSVVLDYQLKAEALKRGYGAVLPEQIQDAIDQGEFHHREVRGRQYLTTHEAVKQEVKMLAYVREGRGKEAPLNAWYRPKADFLNEEQQAAIRHALTDTNNVTIIAGGAGTGKTTLMKEVRDGIEERGKKFIGVAPSAAASRGVMREEGFDKADTLAQLLHNPKMQEQVKDSLIWVDEAGLVGNKDMNQLFEIAKQQNARLLLTGDIRQHSSVAAGDALRILEQDGGIKVARVHEIQRQKNSLNYKMAVRLAAEGKGDAALLKLDRMGDVVEIEEGRHRLTMLVTDYSDAAKAGKSALIVSPTHIEGQSVTDTLREKLKVEGVVAEKERRFLQLKSTNWTEEHKSDARHYDREQLTLEFHQNASGHSKGERWQLLPPDGPQLHGVAATNAAGKQQQIALAEAKRFTVYQQRELALAKGDLIRITKGGKTREGSRINNGDSFTVTGFTRQGHIKLHTGKVLDKNFGHITHGYVTTSHSAQGKTVDRVFIAQSSQSLPASSQQQFYVSISRGREQARIYTDDKKTLEQAVKQDGQRLTAREIAAIDRERSSRKMREKKSPLQSKKQKEHGDSRAL